MDAKYACLAATIAEKASSHPKKRYLVVIAGAPGSGKTTTAAAVVKHLNNAPFSDSSSSSSSNHQRAAILSMDGFHLPRSTLDKLPNHEEAYIRRGAPWTFDRSGFVPFMRQLRAWADTEPQSPSIGGIYAPTFDHETKDPVENGVVICNDVSILLIEGNYVLLDDDEWRDIAPLADFRVFIDTDLQVARERLAKRHVAAGIEKTLEDGFRRVDANDFLNGVMIKEKLIQPDLIVKSV